MAEAAPAAEIAAPAAVVEEIVTEGKETEINTPEPEEITEAPVDLYGKWISNCNDCKSSGRDYFKAGDYQNAKLKYFESLNIMEKLGELYKF